MFVALFVFVGVTITQKQYKQKVELREHYAALYVLADVVNELNNIIQQADRYLDFYQVLISSKPDITDFEIAPYSRLTLEQSPHVAGIFITQNGEVKYAYTNNGWADSIKNKIILDDELLEHIWLAAKQDLVVRQGMPLHSSVDNTKNSAQTENGFYLLNFRGVLFTRSVETHQWGVVSIALDLDSIFSRIGRRIDDEGYLFAARTEAAENTARHWGSKDIFTKRAVYEQVNLSAQELDVALKPKHGWVVDKQSFWGAGAFYYALVVLFGLSAYVGAKSYQNKMQEASLEPLTGTLNRRALQAHAEQLNKEGTPYGLILIDLNHFKDINDQYGHYAGDQVLISVGRRIQRVLRSSDVVSRFGGDEFIVLLELKKGQLEQACERIIKSIVKPLKIEEHLLEVSVSYGCAAYPQDGGGFAQLYRLADERMYDSKRTANNDFS